MKSQLTLDRLKELLSYHPDTGLFVWRDTRGGTCRKGWAAGRPGMGKNAGYRRVTVDGRDYRSGRLAWFYMTGMWPIDQIDHINGIRDDDRWVNLREATGTQNDANKNVYKNSKTGIKGVSLHAATGKWHVAIQVNRKNIYLGRFEDINEAAKAYRLAAEEHFGKYHRSS